MSPQIYPFGDTPSAGTLDGHRQVIALKRVLDQALLTKQWCKPDDICYMDTYDAAHIASFFDAYGEREWHRFDPEPLDRVNLHIHQHYLRRFVKPEMHVLDAGAGPGRFTLELARLGAKVTALDISAGQLAQHRRRLEEAGLEHAVASRHQGDVTDLSRFDDASFDATVCYGGPISYTIDRADDAVAELLRVTKAGGYVLLSVMSKVGATRIFLPGVLEVYAQNPELAENVLKTGALSKASTTVTP